MNFCQTNMENIYVVGDIAGENLLTYTSQNEGCIATKKAVRGNSSKIINKVITQSAFSMPQTSSLKVLTFSHLRYYDFLANFRLLQVEELLLNGNVLDLLKVLLIK